MITSFPHSSANANERGFSHARTHDHNRNRLLERLPASEVVALWSAGKEVRISSREVIADAGDEFTYVFFPEDSVFSFITDFAGGASVEAGTVGPEGFVGIPVLLGSSSWPQRTIAQIPGGALRIPADRFVALLPELPMLSALLNRYLLAYLSQISQTAGCNSQHTVEQRCARWLLLTHDRVGDLEIPLTQEFLSYMLGVRRPSVTITQAQLQRMGLIRYSRGKIQILDRKGLEAISCECYRIVRDEFAALAEPQAAAAL